MKGRPLSGGCREKTLNNHINVDALIQKGACNEARQVYGDGCSPGNDRGGGDRCGRQDCAGNDSGNRSRAPIRRLIESISGALHITLEETTQAEWLYELLQGFVAEVVVCDPRRNRLLSEGSKGDRADARKLA